MSAPTPYESFFRTRDVFTTAEFQAYLAQRMPSRQSRHHAILHYYKTKKRLTRIRRGLYAPVPSYASGSHVPVDPWVLASKMTLDAVLAYHLALEFHGAGYSVWNRAVYASQRPLKPLVRKDCVIVGVSFPTALRHKGAVNVETETALCYGTEVRAATLERAVVDCLDRPYLSGGWEEIGRALEWAEEPLAHRPFGGLRLQTQQRLHQCQGRVLSGFVSGIFGVSSPGNGRAVASHSASASLSGS